MDQPLLERLAVWLRRHPFGVDVVLAGSLALFSLAVQAGYADAAGPLVTVLLTAPLAWRRRAPVPAAAAVVLAGLLQLVVVSDFLFADVAALVMVYALGAYAPRWARRAGLAAGLVGALLASARYFSNGMVESFVVSSGVIADAFVSDCELGDLRLCLLQQLDVQ